MFFRNLTFFRFPITLLANLNAHLFDEQLVACALKPVGPLELVSRGFISPTGAEPTGANLAFWGGNAIWLSLGTEEKILPAAVVDAELRKRLAKLEADEDRKPGGRARKRLKEDLVHELLPRAFVRPSRIDAYLDRDRGLLVVDTASRKQAETFVSELRRALGSFPALPLNAEVAPRAVLTQWVAEGLTSIEGLAIGDEAILKDAADQGAIARVTRQEMHSTEIAQHLDAGKQVARLGLTLSDHVSFTLDEDLAVRKLKLLDGAVESLESVERDGLQAELEARFALLTGEVGELFDVLEGALKLSKVEA